MNRTANIIGTGSYLPKRRILNEDLEKIVKNFDKEKAGMPFAEWVETMTGVKERYYVEDEDAEFMGTEAAKRALDAANMKPEELDFIIASSFTPRRYIPNLACSIGNMIGVGKIGEFPLNTACAGFIYGLAMGYFLIKSGSYKNVLVVATEVLSRITDFGDPRTAVLFGDGAGAVVLQASNDKGIFGSPYLSSEFSDHFEFNDLSMNSRDLLTQIDGQYVKKCYIKMPGGPRVLKRAINAMADAILGVLNNSPYKLEDIDWIVPHQANKRITNGLIEKLNVSPCKVCSTIEKYGNTSGSSVAITLDKAVRGELEGQHIKRGDKIVLTAVGGGYSMGGILIDY